jgi:hypothetical protein
VIVGIDPGNSGAVAVITNHGELLDAFDMPLVDKVVSPVLLFENLNNWEVDVDLVVIERVSSMPKQGVASTFKFGTAYGIAQGVVAGLGWRHTLVTPGVWKKAMGCTADKERSRRLAIERWPDRADLFKLKKHDGRAEAALMAEWGRLHVLERGYG